MEWNKTKTVFIFAFLILDLFLIYQLMEKSNNEFEYLSESSIEEKLAAEDITYVDLPKIEIEETYITGEKRDFSEADFGKLKKQTVSYMSENAIISVIESPITVSEEDVQVKLQQFLKDYIVSGEKYVFWDWNKEKNQLLLFQTYKGKPIYYNENGMLTIQLDEENQLIGYEQTMLENLQEIHDDSDTNTLFAKKALESLYNKNYLTANSEVTKVELGYYNVVPVSGDVQFFAPTWHIIVNGETNYFVNAIEGQIMELIQGGVGNNEFTF